MATIVMESVWPILHQQVFVSLQQIREVPRMLTEAAGSMSGTLRDTDVPHYFRERYVSTGYRPLNQNWSYYFLSLFQCHNETLNVWTHLLPFLAFLVKLRQLTETVDFVSDHHAWPLLVLILSSLTYTACSVAAHLLGSKSELCHYAFYFLDYVGIAQYQYGSAIAHFYYAVDESFHRQVHGIFMPLATVFTCLSCLGCCYTKYCNHNQPTTERQLGQLVPLIVAFLWDSSPIGKRLMTTASNDPAIFHHFSQMALSFSSGFFFTFPVLERCFPGQCDFMGQSHQLFHVLIACFTLSQIHTAHLDFVGRRKLYSRLHGSGDAALFVKLYLVSVVVCALIAAFTLRKVTHILDLTTKSM